MSGLIDTIDSIDYYNYRGDSLRELLMETDGLAKKVAVASALALGIGVAAACYFMFCRKGKERASK